MWVSPSWTEYKWTNEDKSASLRLFHLHNQVQYDLPPQVEMILPPRYVLDKPSLPKVAFVGCLVTAMRRVTNKLSNVFLTSVQTDHSAERAWPQEDRPSDRDCGGLSVPNSPLFCALLQESDFVGPPSPEPPYWLSLTRHQATGVSEDRITVINQTICVNWDDSRPPSHCSDKDTNLSEGKGEVQD